MVVAADRFLNLREVAEALGISRDHVDHLIRDRRLAAVRIGHRTVRIKESALRTYVDGLPAAPFPRKKAKA
jgi:excisionase family DNA binding protein